MYDRFLTGQSQPTGSRTGPWCGHPVSMPRQSDSTDHTCACNPAWLSFSVSWNSGWEMRGWFYCHFFSVARIGESGSGNSLWCHYFENESFKVSWEAAPWLLSSSWHGFGFLGEILPHASCCGLRSSLLFGLPSRSHQHPLAAEFSFFSIHFDFFL